MPKTRKQKEEELAKLTDRLGRMKSCVLVSANGVKVADVTKLRKTLRGSDAEYVVVKKSLLARAFRGAGLPLTGLDDLTTGFALAFGYADEVAPAKLLDAFRKDHESVAFLGGVVGGVVYSAAEVRALAKLPSRQELLAKLVGSLAAPMSRFVSVSSGPLRSLMNVLAAKSKA